MARSVVSLNAMAMGRMKEMRAAVKNGSGK